MTLKYETLFVRGAERLMAIVDLSHNEIATAERTPGNTEALLVGAALAKAADYMPIGFEPSHARRFHWFGEMNFEICLVNPEIRPNEHRNITVKLTADQVAAASAADDPVLSAINFARPKFPPGFMPMGGAVSLRPSLVAVH